MCDASRTLRERNPLVTPDPTLVLTCQLCGADVKVVSEPAMAWASEVSALVECSECERRYELTVTMRAVATAEQVEREWFNHPVKDWDWPKSPRLSPSVQIEGRAHVPRIEEMPARASGMAFERRPVVDIEAARARAAEAV